MKITEKSSFKELTDAICELEGYETYLIESLNTNHNPFERKKQQKELYETRKKLLIYYGYLKNLH